MIVQLYFKQEDFVDQNCHFLQDSFEVLKKNVTVTVLRRIFFWKNLENIRITIRDLTKCTLVCRCNRLKLFGTCRLGL